jgi:hypothetical protein
MPARLALFGVLPQAAAAGLPLPLAESLLERENSAPHRCDGEADADALPFESGGSDRDRLDVSA